MNPVSTTFPAAVHRLLTLALVVLTGAATARAQETWAPVLMFDGSTITIGGITTPIPNGPVPPGIRNDQPFNDNPDPLIAYPNGIAENRLTDEWIVADTYHSRLLRFATDHNSGYATGTFLGVLPVPGGTPYSPVIDDDGTMIVPDFRNNALAIFVPSDSSHTPATYNRSVVTSFLNGGVPDAFRQPRRVALIADPANGMHVALGIGTLVVLDSANNRVLKLKPTGGIAAPAWVMTLSFGQDATVFGSGPGKFVYPTGLALDAAGNIYVTDPNNEHLISIQVFDANGHPLQTISQGLSAPWSVTIDATGRLFVTDSSNNRIAVFAKYDATNPAASMAPITARIGSASQPLGGIVAFPVPNPAGPIGVLQEPTAMIFDQFGRAVIADTDDFRIQIFDKARLNVTALAYPQTLTQTDAGVTLRVSVSLPIGDAGPINNVMPAIPTATFAQGGGAVVTTPPACVVLPGSTVCGPLSSLTGQSLTLANQPLVYAFRFNRITTPVEAVGPVWFTVNASGADAASTPVLSGNAQTYAVAVRGDRSRPPTVIADLNDPRNGAAAAGWYETSPVYVHIQAGLPSPGTNPGQDGFVQEIEFSFGPTPPQEGDFYTCFNYFSADDQSDSSCSLPVYREGITQMWYRALSTPGLYDHLTPSADDPTVNVPGWTPITVQLDFSPPVFTMTPHSPSNPSAVLVPTNNWFSTLPVAFDFTVSDLGSYLDTVQANANGGASTVTSTSGTPFGSGSFTFTSEGLFSPTITAFDRAGNRGDYAATIQIDATAPTYTFTTSPAGTLVGGTRWYTTTPTSVTFTAKDTQSGFAGGATSTKTVPVVANAASTTFTDLAGNTVTATAGPFAIGATAPVITVPPNMTVAATGAAGAIVTYTATATDSNGSLPVVCTPPSGSTFPIATTTVTCTATGHAGNKVTKTFTVTVGHSLPVCTAAVASPKSIWPANHQIVSVGIRGVTNADGAAITYTITSIFQDEPTSGVGYGDVPVDGFGVGTSQAQVRAERGSSSNGRVYHVKYTAATAAGSCSGEVTTGVPQYQGGSVIDGGALYDSSIALPNAVNDTASTVKGVATTIGVLGNDGDPYGYNLTVTSATGAAHGTTRVNSNNTITYTPVPGFAGTDTFTYTVSNGHGGTDSAVVTVTIGAHSRGDDCDHDDHKNGHHDGDGCDHDKDLRTNHHDNDGCDHDRHRNGHYDGDGCDHDRGR